MIADEGALTIGITGASGQLAGRVLELVVEKVGASRVVAITRSPDELADIAAQGVEVRQGDFAEPEMLATAFAGVDRLFMVSVDDATPGVRPKLHGNAIDAAKDAGVLHVVYTSAVKPQHSPMLFLRDHAVTEEMIAERGLAYTFLRNNFYMEVVLQSAPQSLAAGAVFSASNGGAVGYVSRDDCARAAAAVLTSDGHEGAVYDITGLQAWSQAEIATALGKVVGREIGYVGLSEDGLRQGMLDNGVSPQLMEFLVGLDNGIRLGALDVVSRAVEQLTGTPPETLENFLAQHRDALAQSAA